MSQAVRDEIVRLKEQKGALDTNISVLVTRERTLFREREEVLNKLRTARWEQGRLEKQVEKLDEFLEIEKW